MNFPINKYKSIKKFSLEYLDQLNNAFYKISLDEIEKASIIIMEAIQKKKTIFVCGNGGSASIANHFVTDFCKCLSTDTSINAKVVSLSSDYGLISAISNDINFNKIFEYQLERSLEPGDVVILISSSGNSLNIKNAVKTSIKKKNKVIGLSGFDGGFLKKKFKCFNLYSYK